MEEQIKLALEKQNPWWFNKFYEVGLPRLKNYPKILKYLDTPEMIFLLGARRSGKSTLLYQIIASLQCRPEEILFMNLDEPLFQSKADDPTFLSTVIEEYMLNHKETKRYYIFIDEVQNYTHWVQTLKTIYDINKNIKLISTGSTSTLLQNALSTRLSGRYFAVTIYPLSFFEFLEFNKMSQSSLLQKKQKMKEYVEFGGFPRVVLEKDKSLKQELLKNYFQTIYLKDIIYSHKLRNNKDVFELLYFVLSNIGSPFSYTNIGKVLNIAPDTVKEYLFYAEESYLLFLLTKYDYSVKKQLANPRKIYCLDTGIVNSISFKFSENKGRMIENLVFLTLKKQYDIFYHKDKYECDFLIKKERKILNAIQVTLSLQDDAVRKRELKGLLEAMKAHNLKEGIIITEDENEILKKEEKTIHVKSLHSWLEEMK